MKFQLKGFEKAIEVTKIANIHYFEFTKQYHTFNDSHAFHELVYVDSGFISVDAEGYRGLLKESELIIHRANEMHSLSCPTDNAPNVIIIGFQCKNCELDDFSFHPITLSSEQQQILTEIVREGRNVFLPPYDVPNLKDMKKRAEYPFGADQLIKIRLEELFISLVRAQSMIKENKNQIVDGKNIAEISTYIDENFRQKINLNELCFLYGTNKTTLCSTFKSALGETVIGRVNRLRIRESKKLLREGDMNITQIATSVGFSSVHYFNRIFNQYEHRSPSDYMKTIKSHLDTYAQS